MHYLSGDTRRVALEVIKTGVHERELSASIGFSMLIQGVGTHVSMIAAVDSSVGHNSTNHALPRLPV